jgi:hypothetical protein
MRQPVTGGKVTAKKAVPSARRTGDVATKKTVVSQAVINQIKKDGMTAALKKSAGGASAAYKTGVARMYGTKRAAAAVTSSVKAQEAAKKKVYGPEGARNKATATPKKKAPNYKISGADKARRGY